MKHVKIKCKNQKEYDKVKDVLDVVAIEYFQKENGKAIHICGFEKKKDIEAVLEKYGIKKFKVETVKPDFEKCIQQEPEDDFEIER